MIIKKINQTSKKIINKIKKDDNNNDILVIHMSQMTMVLPGELFAEFEAKKGWNCAEP